MHRRAVIKADFVFSGTFVLPFLKRFKRKYILHLAALTLVNNHSVLCFCWLFPPNILVKMMMSDRHFYILPQLASHPCPLLTFTIGGALTHARQSLTSPLPLLPPTSNPPPLASTLTSLLPPVHSQLPLFLIVSFPLFTCRLRPQHREIKHWKTTACNTLISTIQDWKIFLFIRSFTNAFVK